MSYLNQIIMPFKQLKMEKQTFESNQIGIVLIQEKRNFHSVCRNRLMMDLESVQDPQNEPKPQLYSTT